MVHWWSTRVTCKAIFFVCILHCRVCAGCWNKYCSLTYYLCVFTEPVQSRRPLSQTDSILSPRSEFSDTSSLYGGSNYQYPETDELLRIAQQISQSHDNVDRTATKMLRSANTVSLV